MIGLLKRLLRALSAESPAAPRAFTPPPRHADLTKYGAAIHYSDGMGPKSYDEAAATRAAKRARKRSETGRALPTPKQPTRRRAEVVSIRRKA